MRGEEGRPEIARRIGVTVAATVVSALVTPGISYTHMGGLLGAGLLLGVLNAFIKPILIVLSLPAYVLSLGLFGLLLNAFLLWAVGKTAPFFEVASFGWAFVGALVISVVSFILGAFVGVHRGRVRATIRRERPRSPRPPKPRSDGDNGPVIDI